MPGKTDSVKPAGAIDIRAYVGILVFRWQIIVVCFLYCLLGGVLYLRFAPKKFQARCQLMVYRDPKTVIAAEQSVWNNIAYSITSHVYLLQSKKLRDRVIARLDSDWGKTMGSPRKMIPEVSVQRSVALGPALTVCVDSSHSGYSAAFLTALVEEHKAEWRNIQLEASEAAGQMLSDELARLEEKIRVAEDDLIEYQRLHDIARTEARGTAESGYLQSLIGRRIGLTTELMLLDALYPAVKDENVAVVSAVNKLARETGALPPTETVSEEDSATPGSTATAKPAAARPAARVSPEPVGVSQDRMSDAERGWTDLRVRLVGLEQEEKELAANMLPENPRLKDLRKQIDQVKAQLDLAAQVELASLRDRRKALTIELSAIEGAEYKWNAKDLMASQRKAELARIAAVVDRFENNYAAVYSRLHDMRVSEELGTEHFRILEPVESSGVPVWPDVQKVLLAAVVFGLGSGLGIALALQVLDNKIQSIKDVEDELKIPFLGGIPFWANSDLERVIRPIVTEERSSGAIEAYRALRTNVVAALDKINEKIVMVTSADSREGKTLTALNLGIMMAQMNKKVLLVDMDIRRGRLHRSLSVEREPGVTDALDEGRPLRDVVVPTRIENLFLAPTGRSIDNAAELLQAADMRRFFVEIQDDYDYVLLDTSPVLRVTDTVILAQQDVGALVYVARVNHTPKSLIRYSLDMLTGGRIIGMIMNSIVMHKISSLYYTYQYPNYAYYSNAYAYGYDYYYGDGSGRMARRLRRGWHQLRDWGRRIGRAVLPVE